MPRRKTQQEFIELCRKVHGDKYDYSKVNYINKCTKVTIICPVHGEFEQKAEDHYRGRGCWKCWFDKHTELQTYTYDQWLLKARCKYGWKFDYGKVEWNGYNESITVICPKHGEFITTPHNHLYCCTGCPKCGREKANSVTSYTEQDFLKKAVETHRDTYDYSKVKYVNYHTPVNIICKKHGVFKQSPVNHATMGQGCPKCILKNQAKFWEKLKNRFPGYFLEWEYSPIWLKNQRIDIADTALNVGIEFDGIQHWEAVPCFGGEAKLLWQKEQDQKKEECCEQNNFKLFRIKYDYHKIDFENLCSEIQKIIDNTGQITEENGEE